LRGDARSRILPVRFLTQPPCRHIPPTLVVLLDDGDLKIEKYQELHSEYTKVAYNKYAIDPDGVAEVAAGIEKELKEAEVPGFDEEMCPTFEELVHDAAELDADLRMCRAWYQVFMYNPAETLLGDTGAWPRFDMEFSPETWMEEIEEGDSPRVVLVVSPALVKRGNSSGRAYDKVEVIANRQVLCGGPS